MTLFAEIDAVVAVVSLREGGVSKPPYDSANMALHVGDDPVAVLENRSRLCSELDMNPNDLVCAEQVHGNRVVKVTEEDRGNGATNADDALRSVDGLVTDVRRLPLAVFTADCVPIFLYEPTQKVVGIAHAGWRGTLLGAAETLVKTLMDAFGGNPELCRVALGPSAGPCCYEVGDDVARAFRERQHHDERILSPGQQGKVHLDLWEANMLQLERRGVARNKIVCARQCSVCSTKYFSCRRDGSITGRNMSVIMLK